MSDLVLKTNGAAYSGFEAVHVHRSMLEISGGFALYIDDFFQGVTNPKIKTKFPVTLEIAKTKILDGHFDDIWVNYGHSHNYLELTGRDKTGDLVDCPFDATPNEWKGQSVKTVIENLCKPFNITVTVDPSASIEAGKVLDSYSVDEGIPVADLIIPICRDSGILPLNYGDGKLTLTKSGSKKSRDKLTVGKNVEAGRVGATNSNRFSNYTVKGYGIGVVISVPLYILKSGAETP